nr:RHS repeat-associated core domain-containing protein [Paenibacillus alvei]
MVQEEQVPNVFRYSGEYWDAATNLQYLRARWYDPSIGRFINEDTYEGDIKSPLSCRIYCSGRKYQ